MYYEDKDCSQLLLNTHVHKKLETQTTTAVFKKASHILRAETFMYKYHFPSSELNVPLACSSGLKTSKFEQHRKPTNRNKEGPAAGSNPGESGRGEAG